MPSRWNVRARRGNGGRGGRERHRLLSRARRRPGTRERPQSGGVELTAVDAASSASPTDPAPNASEGAVLSSSSAALQVVRLLESRSLHIRGSNAACGVLAPELRCRSLCHGLNTLSRGGNPDQMAGGLTRRGGSSGGRAARRRRRTRRSEAHGSQRRAPDGPEPSAPAPRVPSSSRSGTLAPH